MFIVVGIEPTACPIGLFCGVLCHHSPWLVSLWTTQRNWWTYGESNPDWDNAIVLCCHYHYKPIKFSLRVAHIHYLFQNSVLPDLWSGRAAPLGFHAFLGGPKTWEKVVQRMGLKPITYHFGGDCSIQLSYLCVKWWEHRDSNPKLNLRGVLLYPISLRSQIGVGG